MRTLYEQFAQVWIAALGDPQFRIARAALSLSGSQPQKPRHIPAVRKTFGPAERQHKSHRSQLAHTGNAGQPLHFGMTLGQLADLLIGGADLPAQCVDLLEQPAQRCS